MYIFQKRKSILQNNFKISRLPMVTISSHNHSKNQTEKQNNKYIPCIYPNPKVAITKVHNFHIFNPAGKPQFLIKLDKC